jgi:hypothetical protein
MRPADRPALRRGVDVPMCLRVRDAKVTGVDAYLPRFKTAPEESVFRPCRGNAPALHRRALPNHLARAPRPEVRAAAETIICPRDRFCRGPRRY